MVLVEDGWACRLACLSERSVENVGVKVVVWGSDTSMQ